MFEWAVPICTVFEFLSVGNQNDGSYCLKVVVWSELLKWKAWASLLKDLEELKICLWGAAAAASSRFISHPLCWRSHHELGTFLVPVPVIFPDDYRVERLVSSPRLCCCIWQLCLVCGSEDSTAYLERRLSPSLGLQASHFSFSFLCLIS